MVRNPARGSAFDAGPDHGDEAGGVAEPVVGGILVSLGNPYWVVWWMTVGAAFMTQSLELGLLGIAAFYVGHILSDFSWYGLVSTALASGRRFISDKVYRRIMLVCGAFLTAMGLYFVFTGVRVLM